MIKCCYGILQLIGLRPFGDQLLLQVANVAVQGCSFVLCQLLCFGDALWSGDKFVLGLVEVFSELPKALDVCTKRDILRALSLEGISTLGDLVFLALLF